MKDLFGNEIVVPPKCKLCGRLKEKHSAKALNCPIGKGNFPQYKLNQSYEPKVKR